MTTYEYKRVQVLALRGQNELDKLNAEGRLGWRLVDREVSDGALTGRVIVLLLERSKPVKTPYP